MGNRLAYDRNTDNTNNARKAFWGQQIFKEHSTQGKLSLVIF